MVHDRVPLGTKCCVPRLPDRLVRRPRLEDRLLDGARHRVTLVSGPPGAGKTTLLASALASASASASPPRVAWLSLDGRDDEAGRLAALVAAALHAAAGGDGPVPVEAGGDRLLDVVLERLARGAERCVLMLDDVQELRSASALVTLRRLVAEAPPALDVVLSSRADPAIGLERLRLDGRLAEVRYADLCFDRDEATAFFSAHDLALTDRDAGALWARVEGWVAGLRLAACALESEPDPGGFVADAAATQAAVADYLLEEVLVREDAAAREFLLRTSVAERLTPELAAVLSGDARAEDRLADLERRGIFLVRLDGLRCYRYHALFQALLQGHLRQREPGLIDDLHRRAAAWHLARGLPAEAEEHARAGGDWQLAGRLMLRRWLDRTADEAVPAADLAGTSPADVLASPELALVAAVQACRRADEEDADLYRRALDRAGAPDGDEEARRTWADARRLLDVTFGWAFGADERSRAAVAELRHASAPDDRTPHLRRIAALADAEAAIDAGCLDRARHTLDGLAGPGGPGDPPWHRTVAAAVLAVLDAASGDVVAAEERLAALRDWSDAGPDHPVTAEHVRVATALCAAQRGELRGAAGSAGAAAAAGGPAEWSPRSLRAVDRALRAATRGRAPFFVSLDPATARHPLAERALVALGVLEVVDATGLAVAVGGEGEGAVARARRLLAGDDGDNGKGDGNGRGGVGSQAVAVPAGDRPGGPAARHPRTVVEHGVLAAAYAERHGDHARAERVLREALDVSAATGVRAPLLDRGPALAPVLRRISDDLGPRGVTALDLLDRLHHSGAGPMVESLTGRELQVLQHLPTMMSNAQIAQGLCMSVNTVKTHLKSVYRKLGVDGRREAVLRGRDLELL